MSGDIASTFSVERYAEILAARVHFGVTVEAVLDALGFDATEWEKVEARWTFELGETKVRGQSITAMRFASAYGRARRRLARGELSWAEAVARVTPGAAADAARSDASATGSASGAPNVLIPSYMKEVDRAAAPAQSPSSPRSGDPRAPSAPSAVVPAPAKVAVGARTVVTAPPTEEIFLTPPDHKLPFKNDPAAPPPAAAPVEPRVDTGTAIVDDPEAQGPSLPEFPLEKYAGITVEMRRTNVDRKAALARYGFTSEEHLLRVHTSYRVALGKDPALRARYEALVIRYTSQLAGK